MGLGSFLKKGTGMNYLDGEDDKGNSSKKESKKSAPSTGLSKHDEKLLKNLEQTLKKVNNQIEDMLEKVRVRRGL
ncbi:MAG: hypothetical protein CMH62_01880 [Nanoarchaeota archaeon]|nr:hypothetical protein [Nanoarchaeota archaeon]|tara:strand:- start:2593 stop:2817 length:225 start_codon:yes stop_codon:yes gene_type:complete